MESKEAVGLYAVDSLEELQDVVDEITDPSECEFAEVSNGGIAWPKPGAAIVPFAFDCPDDEHPDLPAAIGETSLTEGWLRALIDDEAEFLPLGRLGEVGANDR